MGIDRYGLDYGSPDPEKRFEKMLDQVKEFARQLKPGQEMIVRRVDPNNEGNMHSFVFYITMPK